MVGGDARDDLASFWLRKTKKPVLAVLLVQKKGGQPQLFRGTNMEASSKNDRHDIVDDVIRKSHHFSSRSALRPLFDVDHDLRSLQPQQCHSGGMEIRTVILCDHGSQLLPGKNIASADQK